MKKGTQPARRAVGARGGRLMMADGGNGEHTRPRVWFATPRRERWGREDVRREGASHSTRGACAPFELIPKTAMGAGIIAGRMSRLQPRSSRRSTAKTDQFGRRTIGTEKILLAQSDSPASSDFDFAGQLWSACKSEPMPLPPLYYTSPRGQCAVMLLAALHDMYINDGIGNVTKREAIQHITARHWFDIHDEDRKPYESQRQLTGEPRWHTLIAWARKDGVIRDYVSYEARDSWGMTRRGRDAFEIFREHCATGKKSVSPCFLWSVQFKKLLNPNYAPGSNDKKRPQFFYRDAIPDIFAEF